jgi:NagD protein
MIGDRVYTDMRMAHDAGAAAVLTLTGETKMAHVEALPKNERPDLVVATLAELAEVIERSR